MNEPMDTSHDRFTDRLSDYLDDGLAAAEARDLEQHLATCADCRATLDDLRLVVARARELPASVPVADLWPAIEAQLGDAANEAPAPVPARAKVTDVRSHPRWWSRPLTFSLAQAAAAAVLLVVLAGGGAWFAFRAQPQRVVAGDGVAVTPAPLRATAPAPAPGVGPVAQNATSGPAPDAPRTAAAPPRTVDAVPATAVSVDPRYDATVAELQRLLVHERANLDTSTVRILEQNLALVDRALAEAQRAVESDPNNPYLRSYLASTMRRKVDLLRRATVIAGAQG
jgi:anti-sigma factor RsiW